MTDPLALTLETKIAGIPLDVSVKVEVRSTDKVRILATTMAGSQFVDLHINQLHAIHGLILRAISTAENAG